MKLTKLIGDNCLVACTRRLGAMTIIWALAATMLWSQGIAPSQPIAFEPGARRVPDQRVVQPNFRQAELYNSNYLRQFVYDTAVRPNWIGKSDEFWYSFKTSLGTNYYRVNPEKGTKLPLFDQVKLAAQLSELTKRPVESAQLALNRLELDDETDTMKFVIGDKQYEFSFKTETLKELGPAPRGPVGPAGPPGAGGDREEMMRQLQRQREEQQREEDNQQTEQATGGRGGRGGDRGNHRFWAPDRKSYVFARGHNLYYVAVPPEAILKDEPAKEKTEAGEEKAESKSETVTGDQQQGGEQGQRRDQGRRRGRGRGNNSDSTEQSTEKSETKEKSETNKTETETEKTESTKESGEKKTSESTTQEKKEGDKTEGGKTEQTTDKKEGGWPGLFKNQDQQEQKQDVTEKQEGQKQEGQKETTEEKKTDGQQDKQDAKTDGKQDEKQDNEKVQKNDSGDNKSNEKKNQDGGNKDGGNKDGEDKDNGKKTDDKVVDNKVEKQEDQQKTDQQKTEQSKDGQQAVAPAAGSENAELPIPKIDPKLDDTAIALTTDGTEEYSFAGRVGGGGGQGGRRGGGGGGQEQTGEQSAISETTLTRPNINWSKDSQSFYALRRDSRGVKELWVINSLAEPRPTLEKYPYPMPGEDSIRKSELYYFTAASKKLTQVKKKWKDESYSDIQFNKAQDELRFLRRDRLLRNVAFCSMKLADNTESCLFEEGFEQAHIAPQGLRYLEGSDEVIWWSERSGWGHFYLYTTDGKLVNQITSGNFLASRIVDIDEKNRVMYFTGSGREPNENVYYQHTYSVRLDGTGLRLLDPGDANHTSVMSPSKQYLVDSYSRVDLAPASVLRRADGSMVMELETTDLSRLEQVGWRMPETFVVKAADGVTDLYGNMYKPFDFNPNQQYPVITYVYPGPQQEGTRHTFTATAGEQQLAQIGFIVIQVGHRGGSPGRSKAYGSFGYFNLRDYGLADKKSAIEQLAQRYSFIDVERVGIYGHSGGGFMTAAALMLPPYNDFFKAGFSTAGNHDNNIYNNSWSERYHGLKEVAVTEANQRGTGGREQQTGQREQQGQREQVGQREGFPVSEDDFFNEFEMLNDEDAWEFDQRLWDRWTPGMIAANDWQDEVKQETQKTETQSDKAKQDQQEKVEVVKEGGEKKDGEKKDDEKKDGDNKDGEKKDGEKQVDVKQDGETKEGEKGGDAKQGEVKQEGDKKSEAEEKKTKFEIRVPTNAELAANLKHHLFLVHGELDNNVHPANTLRLVDALIKANKRFDMLYLPATRHGFGQYQPYVTQRMFEFFAQRLLNDYESGTDRSPGQ